LSFINWLTLTATIGCFDDSFLRHVLPRFVTQKAEQAEKLAKHATIPVINGLSNSYNPCQTLAD